MSASILTNTSAMVALQTLRNTNSNLQEVNGQISTGKEVATAKDNAAVFAISEIMESDVTGFKAVSDSLALGKSTVAVASNAAGSVGDLLNEIKGKIISANEENVDRNKLQDEVSSLRDQISGIVSAAQFNGLNMLSNTDTEAGSGTVGILSSLDRSADGTVSTNSISVNKQDLGTGASAVGAMSDDVGVAATVNDGASGVLGTLTTGSAGTGEIQAGMSFQAISGGTLGLTESVDIVARDGDTLADVTSALVDGLNKQASADGLDFSFATTGTVGEIGLTNNSGANVTTVAGDVTQSTGATAELDGTIGGGLEALGQMDVSTEAGAESALGDIEGLIQTTVDAQAAFGTSEKRIDLQNDFMSSLIDSFDAGIGSLVDADLEEASARLQSLQVQQQLATQALSIANQQPQNLLALFR